jgi:hypothetical protein
LDKVKPNIENIRGLNLAVVKFTTVQVTNLHCSISMIGMICFEKSGLAKDSYIVQKE